MGKNNGPGGAGPNKGNGKGDGNKDAGSTRQRQRQRQTQRSQQYNKMAANNIALQDQSQADMLGTLEQQTQQDLQRRMNSAQSIYGGGLEELRNTTPTDYSGITSQMNNALAGLAPNFGGQAYQAPGEGAAGNALGLAYGEAGNSMLANMAAREGQHQASSERQMGLMGTYAQDRVHQDIDDSLQQYRNQLQNLRANDPYQVAQEATRLEDQAVSNKGMMSQIRSDREFSKYLQDILGNTLSGGNHPGGNGGPGGNGPGNNGGNQPPVGNSPPQGGYGDTSAGGNNFSQSPQQGNIDSVIQEINQMKSFEELPPWLQNLYRNATGHNRWALVQNRPRRRQIFRRTRPTASGLWAGQQEQENPFQGLGGGF